jgi:hypothetical protein
MKKKIFRGLFFACALFLIPMVTSASNIENVTTTQQLHQELKDANLLTLDNNGLIVVPDNLNDLGVDKDLIKEYNEKINVTNKQVTDGILSFNDDLSVKDFTIEEIADKVFENNKKDNDSTFTTMATYLNAVNLVESNRAELENIYDIQNTVNPGNAWSFAVGWWVGNVKPDGDWDYKTVSGYAPWSKTFTMSLYNGTENHNSKWLGNYNYGYTGQFLFPLSVLHAGGDAVSYALNWEPDSQYVKNVITRGYNDTTYY